jgi:hypothetical protein
LSRIGQTDPKAIKMTRMVDSVPSRMMNTGIRAGPGTARRNCSEGSSRSDAMRERPIRTPSGTPTKRASIQPPSSRATLGSRSWLVV